MATMHGRCRRRWGRQGLRRQGLNRSGFVLAILPFAALALVAVAMADSDSVVEESERLQKPVLPQQHIAQLRAELKQLGFGTRPFDDVANAVADRGSPELAFRLLLDGRDMTPQQAAYQGNVAQLRLYHLAEKAGWGPLINRPEGLLTCAANNQHPEVFFFVLEHWPARHPRKNWMIDPKRKFQYSFEYLLESAVKTRNLAMVELITDSSHHCPAFSQRLGSAITNAIDLDEPEIVKCLHDAIKNLPQEPPKSYFTSLHFAVWKGRPRIVEMLLERGEKLDSCTAAGLGRVDDLKQLFDGHPPANLSFSLGPMPLHWAAKHGQLEAARYLLDQQQDPNANVNNRWTPLHLAVENHHREMIVLLLDRGADPSLQQLENGNGSAQLAPIHLAAAQGDLEIVKLMIERGASPWLLGSPAPGSRFEDLHKFGQDFQTTPTPLTLAAQHQHREIVDYLLRLMLEEMQSRHRRGHESWKTDRDTAFSVAAGFGDLELVRAMRQAGAQLESPYSLDRKFPLEAAAEGGHREIVSYLLDQGAAVDGAGPHCSHTPLHAAAAKGHLDLVRLLLDAGATIDARRPATIPPPAAKKGSRGYAWKNPYLPGDRPLTSAVRYQHPEVVKLLLERGARPNLEAPADVSAYPITFHAQMGDYVRVPLEIALVPIVGSPLQPREMQSARYLIEAGARLDPTVANSYLEAAVRYGDVNYLEFLESADIKVAADHPRLLMTAVGEGHRDMVRALLARGISPLGGQGLGTGQNAFRLSRTEAHTLMRATIIESLAGKESRADELLPIGYQPGEPLHRFGADRSQTSETIRALDSYYGGQPLKNNFELIHAIGQDDAPTVAKLLEQGCDPNQPFNNAYPLQQSMYRANPEIVALLFRYGAKLEAIPTPAITVPLSGFQQPYLYVDPQNHNPLVTACRAAWEEPETIKLLMAHGADVNSLNLEGNSPLHLAIREHRMPLARAMVTERTQYDVYTAAALGNLTKLQQLLDADPWLFQQARNDGTTPLDWAMLGGQREATRLLLAYGATFDKPADKFVEAVTSRDVQFLDWLLQTVDDKDMTSEILGPALEAAIRAQPQPAMVRKLLAYGADPRGSPKFMVWAAWHGNIETMDLLVRAGANVNDCLLPNVEEDWPFFGRDANSQMPLTPLRMTLIPTGYGIALPRYGREKYASHQEMYRATLLRNAAAARWLLEHGASLRLAGSGLVHQAVRYHDPDLLQCLLEAGGDPNDRAYTPQSNRGEYNTSYPLMLQQTALYAAVEFYLDDESPDVPRKMIDLLLDHDAQVHVHGQQETPYQLILKHDREGELLQRMAPQARQANASGTGFPPTLPAPIPVAAPAPRADPSS